MTDDQPERGDELARELADPERTCREAQNSGASNITCASATPGERAPSTARRRRRATSRQARPPWLASATVTAGLKCAPETPPKVRISATRPAPGRDRVRQQRERDVSAREPLGHDPGADDGRQQEGGADRLRRRRAGQRGAAEPVTLTLSPLRGASATGALSDGDRRAAGRRGAVRCIQAGAQDLQRLDDPRPVAGGQALVDVREDVALVAAKASRAPACPWG